MTTPRTKDPGGRPKTQTPECRIDGCSKKPNAKNLCKTHYSRLQRHGDPLKGAKPTLKPCTIDGCETPSQARGWCGTHYERWRRYGDPHHVKLPSLTPEPKAKPKPPGPCIIDGCNDERRARGFCNAHYKRWRKHGDPNIAGKPRKHVPPPKPKPAIDPPEHLTNYLAARRARLGRNNAA